MPTPHDAPSGGRVREGLSATWGRVTDSVRTTGRTTIVLYVLTVCFWGFVTWHALAMRIPRPQFGVVVLGAATTFYTLDEAPEALADGERVRAAVLAIAFAVGAVATVYVVLNYVTLQNVRIGYNTGVDYAVAAAFVATIVYLTYDAYGGIFTSIIVAAVLYAQFGYVFPSWLHHGGITIEQGLQFGMLNLQGVYGNLTQVMGTLVAPFLLLAGLIRLFGGFALVMEFSIWVSRRYRSAVAQMAVVTSMLIGSINGSALANTAITGSFTIPILQTTGIDDEQAAAIESVASTGGQIMPPVMGVAAFLMADILQRPLLDIFVAAVVPALVFYGAVILSVYQIARRAELTEVDLDAVAPEDLPESRDWFDGDARRSAPSRVLEVLQFVLPLVVLFYMLGVRGTTVLIAGMAASGAMIVAGVGYATAASTLDDTNLGLLAALVETVVDTAAGLREGARSLGPLTIVVAAIGLMVDSLFTTGLPSTLSFALIDLSGGVTWLLLALTGVLCVVLGMGMPTSAAYLVVALLIAPRLVDFGIPELPAHFFVLYFAVLAVITPPIAPGVVVAAGIADADFWRSCLEAIKIAAPMFVLPFAFVYDPALVTTDVTLRSVTSALLLLFGAGALSIGLNSRSPLAGIHDALDAPVVAWGVRSVVAVAGIAIMVRPF